MAIIPAGLPTWSRANDHVAHGGNVEKRDLFNSGAIDALTDVPAKNMTRTWENLAACALTAPFMAIYVRSNDPVTEPPLVMNAQSMNGVSAGYVGDAPPAGFPTVVRNADTDYTVTFDSTYADEYGQPATEWFPNAVIAQTLITFGGTTGVELSSGGDPSAVRIRLITSFPDNIFSSFGLQVW